MRPGRRRRSGLRLSNAWSDSCAASARKDLASGQLLSKVDKLPLVVLHVAGDEAELVALKVEMGRFTVGHEEPLGAVHCLRRVDGDQVARVAALEHEIRAEVLELGPSGAVRGESKPSEMTARW